MGIWDIFRTFATWFYRIKRMIISDITRRMIAFSEGNLPDINHFMMVWAYARTIGLEEGLDDRTQSILEIAALVHDMK